MKVCQVIARCGESFSFLMVILFSSLVSYQASAQNYSSRQTPQQVEGGYETRFWAYVPEEYPAEGPYPLLISLHGGSGIGSDLTELFDPFHENPAFLISADRWFDLPFVVVSPQMELDPEFSAGVDYNEQNWPAEQVDELIDFVVANYNIDESRIYVTGISLGAAGTWTYAAAHPERVAAILPLGGKTPRGDACALKDVPIWVFHGENDFLVPTRFATDMADAITSCSPAGKYIPHVNLSYSMEHPVWNQLYNLTGGYDIYNWLLSFEKGNDSNKAPFVFPTLNMRILKPADHFYLTAEYFDSDGTIENILWTQLSNGSPMLPLQDVNSKFLKINTSSATADQDYIFRITVTDNDGASSFADVSVRLLSVNDARAITSLELTGQFGGPALGGPSYGLLSNDMIIDMAVTGSKINILAGTQGSVRVKWGINSDQHVRNSSTPSYIKSPSNGTLNSGWTVTTPGDYLVCATAFSNNSGNLGDQYTSLCYKITFRNDEGITKYYLNGANPASPSAWKTGEDGSGSSPTVLSDPNQWFYINGTASTSEAISITGENSKLVIGNSGRLTIGHAVSGPFHIEGKGTVEILSGGSVGTFSSVSRTSTIIYNTSTVVIPAMEFGHLILRGAGNKILSNGFTNVRGNLTAEAGAIIVNANNGVPSANGAATIYASGNVSMASPTAFPFTLRFIEGYGNQYLSIPGDQAFRILGVEKGITVSLQAPGISTLTIGSGSGGGILDVHTFGLLKLNGHNLRLINNAAINPNAGNGTLRLGKIELSGSTLTVFPTTPGAAFNLFPSKDSKDLKLLDVTLPNTHEGFNIKDSLVITEGVRVTNGKINSNGYLTIQSTPTSTAYVAPVVGTGSIVGDVNVERMLMPGDKYRYLSFPVENFSVADLQQFFPVTGDFEGSTPDYSTAASLYVYENVPSPGWVPFPTTTHDETFTIGGGYAVYVRETIANKKLVFTGPLHIGGLVYDLAENPTESTSRGWTLIGNPYAAPILWEGSTPVTGWSAANIEPAVHIRDNEQADFKIWDGDVGDEEFSGMIATGQSFWVRSIDNEPALSITEAAKLELTSPVLFRAKKSDVVFLSIALRKGSRKNTCFIKFNSKGKPTWIRGSDSMKQKGGHANISIVSADHLVLAIKNLSDTICSQEARLLVETNGSGIYSISCKGTAFDNLIDKLYIFDSYTNAKTEIRENNDFAFEVTSDPVSRTPNRFMLIIEKSNVDQPVITLQDGFLVSSVEAGVQWMLNGTDIEGATGQVFLPIEDGDYTVRTLGKNCSKVSEAFSFRVTGMEKNGQVKIYPNPASRYINVSGLSPSERVQYEIVSLNGVSVQADVLNAGDSGEAEIKISSLASGFYVLRIAGSNRYEFKLSIR